MGGFGSGERGTSERQQDEAAFSEGAAAGADEIASDDGEDGEGFGIGAGDRFAGGERQEFGFEEGAGGEGVAFGEVHRGLEVVEVDAGEGMSDVEVAGLAVETEAVPVEDAVGRIGVLLDFVDEESRADGVEAAGGDENGIAGLRRDGVHEVRDGAVADGLLELVAGDALAEADVEFRSGITSGDEPHFCFWFTIERGCKGGWRMDLDGEVVAGVEDFDEDGEAVGIGEIVAEDFGAVLCPEIVEGGAGIGAVVDDGLLGVAVDDFP